MIYLVENRTFCKHNRAKYPILGSHSYNNSCLSLLLLSVFHYYCCHTRSIIIIQDTRGIHAGRLPAGLQDGEECHDDPAKTRKAGCHQGHGKTEVEEAAVFIMSSVSPSPPTCCCARRVWACRCRRAGADSPNCGRTPKSRS